MSDAQVTTSLFFLKINGPVFCSFEVIKHVDTQFYVFHACLQDVAIKVFSKQEYSEDVILSFRQEVVYVLELGISLTRFYCRDSSQISLLLSIELECAEIHC